LPLQIVKSYKVLRSFVGTVCISYRLCFSYDENDGNGDARHGSQIKPLVTLGFLSTGITGQYQFLMERLQLLQFFMQVSAMCS